MNSEQKEYLRQLVDLLNGGKRITATSLCRSGSFVTLVWRVAPAEQGCTFEIIGRDPESNEHVLLQQSYLSAWEIFGNLPFDPLAFTADPNQEE